VATDPGTTDFPCHRGSHQDWNERATSKATAILESHRANDDQTLEEIAGSLTDQQLDDVIDLVESQLRNDLFSTDPTVRSEVRYDDTHPTHPGKLK